MQEINVKVSKVEGGYIVNHNNGTTVYRDLQDVLDQLKNILNNPIFPIPATF